MSLAHLCMPREVSKFKELQYELVIHWLVDDGTLIMAFKLFYLCWIDPRILQ